MEVGDNLSDKAKVDLVLLESARNGSQQAYAQLMDRYRDSIYFMMYKMVKNQDDADDLTIEAFGKAFSRLDQYSPNYAFSTWLFKIASNNCIDFIRKKRIKVTSMDTGYTTSEGEVIYFDKSADVHNPEEAVIHNQKVSRIINYNWCSKIKFTIWNIRYMCLSCCMHDINSFKITCRC